MRVLIVEDELIIAQDLSHTLRRIGHSVTDVVTNGEAALAAVSRQPPDLVLMDIRLSGPMDGIEAARQIYNRWGVPVIFLTAHADDQTVREALLAEPWAYLLKPFDERELEVAIAVAAYKHRLERRLQASERHLRTTLTSIGDGVIVTDPQSRITFINPVAARLLGVTPEEAIGWPLVRVYTLVATNTGLPADSATVHTDTVNGLPAPATLLTRNGERLLVEHTVAPITGDDGTNEGVVIIFRDVSERQRAINQLHESKRRLQHVQSLLEQREQNIITFGTLAHTLREVRSRQELYAAIITAGTQLLPNYRGTLLIYNPNADLVDAVGHWGEPLVHHPVPRCTCWGERFWSLSLAGDTHACHFLPKGLLGERMCLPIHQHNEVIGLLSLYHPDPSNGSGYQLAVALAEVASLGFDALADRLESASQSMSS
ncbi:MAG: histidine kinase [Chloroflexus aggregans]|uniref:Histidine kinase n=1 Tax=Chloroflexus aggregans TaxID=152260 RepID=A0A2J6XAT4_9CHLR|nr:MAG: histidine kinase [Chloroflexus aggregans]